MDQFIDTRFDHAWERRSLATTKPVNLAAESAKPAGSLGDRVRSLRLPPESESRTIERKGLWAAVAVGVIALTGYWYYSRPDAADIAASADQAQPASTSVSSSETATPATAPVERPAEPQSNVVLTSAETSPAPAPLAESGEVALQATGYIVPAHQILVSPKVSGMILELNVEEGMRVKQGDVLARLEGVDYTADVARATAALASAKQRLLELQNGSRPEEIQGAQAELHESEAQREQLYSELKRTRALRNAKTVPESDLEKAESAYKAMDRRAHKLKNNLRLLEIGPRTERIEVAKADVAEAEAALTKAQWQLSNTTVVAPISGTVLKKNAEIGNVVNPVAFNGSFSLCEMADLSDLEVDLTIQERGDLSKVRVGQKCLVRAEAFPERVYEGVVSRLMPIADRAKGAVPVRVKVRVPADEEGVYLKPEMSVVVSFYK